MSADTVVAVSAVVIAVASLGVSLWQARSTRQHNPHSVRPVLQLHLGIHDGARSGIRLINVGLGPAVVVRTLVRLDGEVIGRWDRASADTIRTGLTTHLNAVTFGENEVLAAGYSEYLLSLPTYDASTHELIKDLLDRRLAVTIHYESLYGGEGFCVTNLERGL